MLQDSGFPERAGLLAVVVLPVILAMYLFTQWLGLEDKAE